MIDINEFIEGITDELIENRRMLHTIPEVGFTEYVTTWHIVNQLNNTAFTVYYGRDALDSDSRYAVPDQETLESAEQEAAKAGVPVEMLDHMSGGHTGCVAKLDTGRPGPHIALRFDIDALPIIETDSDDHIPVKHGFCSQNHGAMHACGHDGHTSIGLAVAAFINRFKTQLTGTYTLLFQPAEEGGKGAKAMVEKGWLEGVDFFLSGHLGIMEAPAGTVAATTERFLASSKLDVHFKGKSAHSGLEPNAGNNALLAAATAALHLHAIPRHKDGATRVNVGTMKAGSGRNAIADTAHIALETRGETTVLDDYMQTEAKRILKASGDLHGVETHINMMGRALNGKCDPVWKTIIPEALKETSVVTDVWEHGELGASEDVTYMMEAVQQQGGKATFMLFPSPLPAGHHHPAFDFEEHAMTTAVAAFVSMIAYLNEFGSHLIE
ncbi:Indole-3-acetyl-aspartic acid hydrolase [Lentibacillus sp. JNUCC-1]|uniref:amidohydrolase n=1 Tax=Lentibacillus sp. JNUCC-1 TaxID=2654513 RepID=UPI0012E7535A|nr:amidohydrolase [Lentibacillus sp. JNUCC-1]MUV36706.1 Indole-3-acetyl-aspartic acid hydrolase [Lentibacillus sp. JNUCC-1]